MTTPEPRSFGLVLLRADGSGDLIETFTRPPDLERTGRDAHAVLIGHAGGTVELRDHAGEVLARWRCDPCGRLETEAADRETETPTQQADPEAA
ncbi:MAG: hypothetical protein ABIL09_18365 [Gemmatimonadota bacterium]